MSGDGHLVLRQTVLAAGQEWNVESHGWTFIRVARGDAYWVSVVEPKPVSTGELVVVAANGQGTLRASQIAPVTFHHFKIYPEYLLGLLSLEERQRLENGVFPTRAIEAEHPAALRFRSLSEAMEIPNGLFQRCQMLQITAATVASIITAEGSRRSRPIFARERFHYLTTQFTEIEVLRSPVAALADFCNCTQRHFRTLFRRRFGISVKARQQQVLLREAAERLENTPEDINAIARYCGYRQTRAFEIAFKKQFRTTPAQWRQRVAKAPRQNGKAEDSSDHS